MGEDLDSADFCVMTGQLLERSGSSGTASQRAKHAVESLSSDARVHVCSLGPGFVLHIMYACTAAVGGQVLIRWFHNRGGGNTFEVSSVVVVFPCRVGKTLSALNFKATFPWSVYYYTEWAKPL